MIGCEEPDLFITQLLLVLSILLLLLILNSY